MLVFAELFIILLHKTIIMIIRNSPKNEKAESNEVVKPAPKLTNAFI